MDKKIAEKNRGKKEVSAGIIIFSQTKKEPEFLLLQSGNDNWNFAKGHVEKNETLKEAALREVKEETALRIKELVKGFHEKISYFFCKTSDNKKEKIYKIVHYFLAPANTKKIKVSSEHKNFIWAPYAEALKMVRYKNTKQLLHKAYKFLTNISRRRQS